MPAPPVPFRFVIRMASRVPCPNYPPACQVPDTVQAAASRAVSIADELRLSVGALSPSELCSSTAAGTTTALADFEAQVQQLVTDVHVLHTADTVVRYNMVAWNECVSMSQRTSYAARLTSAIGHRRQVGEI